MRYLVFLRGIPGSGKSTFVKENELTAFTVSSDKVRILLKPPVLSINGNPMLSQEINPRVWGLIYSVIECRMKEGDFTVLDATNAGNADISKYRKLVKNYRCKAFCVDFSDVTLEIAKERNLNRPAYEIVPEPVIDEMHSIICTQQVPSFVTVIKPHEFHERLQYKIVDFSNYNRIHHIGDINGNYAVLANIFEFGFDERDLYIFTGDYIVRTAKHEVGIEAIEEQAIGIEAIEEHTEGIETNTPYRIENVEVIKFLISIMSRNNVILLEGDHERCFYSLIKDKEKVQSKLSDLSDILSFLPESDRDSISKSCLLELYRKMEPCICYNYENKCVLVTHGGLSNLPENLTFVGSSQMVNGVGKPEDAGIVAASFNRNTNENTYQVHGHRNPENLPIDNGRTFNLCQEARKRNLLRILTLDRDGFHSREYGKDF